MDKILNINNLRKEYCLKSLELNTLNPDPFLQFNIWFQEAVQAQIVDVNVMNLATASLQGLPSNRSVLLKGIDTGFLFFTNYESRKGRELIENPYGCLTFLWKELERQVIIEGKVEQTSYAESYAYFSCRPRQSQISVWASHQGETLESRKVLEEKTSYYEKLYHHMPVPLPPYWGGFRLIPTHFEFWQGRPNRQHDRFHFYLEKNTWQIKRLSP